MENIEHILFTYEAAAQMLSISPHTVKKYVKLKQIETISLGRARRISKSELERIAREGLKLDEGIDSENGQE